MSAVPAGGHRPALPWWSASSVFLLALLLPAALLLQRQNWVVPNTGLGVGAGLVVAAIAAGATLVLLAAGRLPALPPDGAVPVLLLIWLVAIYASYFMWARDGIWSARLYADIQLGQLTIEAIFVVGLMSALGGERHLWLFVKVLVACGALYGALLVVTSAAGTEIARDLRLPLLKDTGDLSGIETTRAGFLRPQGMAGHPLEAGSVAAILVPLGLGLSRGLAARQQRWRLWACATAVTALGAVSTMSRSAAVALIAAIACMALRWPFPLLVRAAGAASGVAVAAVLAFPDRAAAYLGLFRLNSASDASLFSRQQARQHVADVLAARPWTGEGMGTQSALGRPILDNQYLGFIVEQGVPSLLAFIALLAVPVWLCLHRAPGLPAPRGQLALGAAGSLAALAVVLAVLDAFAFPQIRMLTFILLGLAGAVCTRQMTPG